jgi:hypothetical protein
MKAAGTSETLVCVSETTRRYSLSLKAVVFVRFKWFISCIHGQLLCEETSALAY